LRQFAFLQSRFFAIAGPLFAIVRHCSECSILVFQSVWVGVFCVPSMVLAFDAINGNRGVCGFEANCFWLKRFLAIAQQSRL